MNARLPRLAVAALLLSLSVNALAGPGGPGWRGGPGPGWGGPGPRHGHGLPDHARELWIGSALYFVAAGTYYMWNADRRQYIVVEAAPGIPPARSARARATWAGATASDSASRAAREGFHRRPWEK